MQRMGCCSGFYFVFFLNITIQLEDHQCFATRVTKYVFNHQEDCSDAYPSVK